jgi:hypothetical protein
VSNRAIGKIKSTLDQLFENRERARRRMSGRAGVKFWIGKVHPEECVYAYIQYIVK